MSREQGPHFVGMRPAAIAADRRRFDAFSRSAVMEAG
jgi:hypothetical protein